MRVRSDRRWDVVLLVLATVLVTPVTTPARDGAVTLEEVLRRMHSAVVEYEDDLAALVLEEEYEQRVDNIQENADNERKIAPFSGKVAEHREGRRDQQVDK